MMTLRRSCLLSLCVSLAWTAGCAVGEVDKSDIQSNAVNQPLTASSVPRGEEERLYEPLSKVTLAWEGVPDDGTVLETRGTLLTLNVGNTTDTPLVADLEVTGDDGGKGNERVVLGRLQLAARGQQTLTVDASRFGFALGALRFSGRLHVTARVSGADGSFDEPSISRPVYFHPASGSSSTAPPSLTFYGKKALKASFRSGDYRGVVRELASEQEPDGLMRVMDVGTGNGSSTALRNERAELARHPENDGLLPAVTTTVGGILGGLGGLVSNALQPYRTCVLFRSQTIDSGIPIANGPNAGGLEDYRTDWNAGVDVPAYGVRVKLKLGDWEQTFDTEPSTGCFNWSHEEPGPFLLTVYGYATNAANTFARIHNAPDSFSDYPGTTYRLTYFYTPVPGSTNYVAAGSYDSEWTAMAALSFGLLRLNVGAGNKAFHVAMDNAEDGWSSAHWGESNSYITEGRHYLKVDNWDATSSKLGTQRKFLVSHEFGHAFAAIYYGSHPDAVNGWEPGGDSSHNVTPSSDDCALGDSYSIGSKEWNSLGFREGFAHFVASIVWNNHSSEGSFHWLGSHHDLERYSDGIGASAGGRLENVCCSGPGCTDSWNDAGTIEDWMLFFWDWYTNVDNACPFHPTRADMFRLYRDTRLGGGLTDKNYFTKMRAAAQGMNLPQCLKTTRFDSYASWNGIDN